VRICSSRSRHPLVTLTDGGARPLALRKWQLNTDRQEKEALEESIRLMQEQAEAGTQAATQASNAKTAERRKAEAKLQQLLEEAKVLEASNQDSYQVRFPSSQMIPLELKGSARQNEGKGTSFSAIIRSESRIAVFSSSAGSLCGPSLLTTLPLPRATPVIESLGQADGRPYIHTDPAHTVAR
jgi:hypothetical protein